MSGRPLPVRSDRGSLVDDIIITQEPRGLLGRYFLAAEQQLAAHGVTVRKASFETFIGIYQQHETSWNGLTPILDPRLGPIPDDTAACFVGIDRHGAPVTTMAIRYFDLAGVSLKQACEDLTFWYGANAPAWRDRVSCKLTCPAAERIAGRLMWSGGFWVRPDRRHDGLASMMPDIGRYFGLSRWQPDVEISVGAPAFKSTRVQRAYEFEHHDDGFTISKDGQVFFQGYLVWSSVGHLHRRLARIVEAVSHSTEFGRRQQIGLLGDVVGQQ